MSGREAPAKVLLTASASPASMLTRILPLLGNLPTLPMMKLRLCFDAGDGPRTQAYPGVSPWSTTWSRQPESKVSSRMASANSSWLMILGSTYLVVVESKSCTSPITLRPSSSLVWSSPTLALLPMRHLNSARSSGVLHI